MTPLIHNLGIRSNVIGGLKTQQTLAPAKNSAPFEKESVWVRKSLFVVPEKG